ncbi:MAG: ABC transporter ATP-binding protein [Chloroflexota bacterium]
MANARQSQGISIHTLRRLLAYLRPYRTQLLMVVGFVIISTLLTLLAPYLIGVAIDNFIAKENRAGLVAITMALATAYVGIWLSEVVQGRIMAKLAQQSIRALRRDLFAHLQSLSLGFFDSQSTGDLMSRLTNDLDVINMMLSHNFIRLFISVFTIISIIVTMFVLNIWLATASLLVIPVMILFVFLIGGRLGPRFRRQQNALGTLNGLMEENLSAQRIVIAYGQQTQAVESFHEANEQTRHTAIHANQLAASLLAVVLGLTMLNIAIIVGVGAYLAIIGIGGVTAGLIAAFMTYSQRLIQPLMSAVGLYNTIVASLAAAERVFEILDTQPTLQDKPQAKALEQVEGSVNFDHVDFGYDVETQVLFDNTFAAKPGQMIGLCGPTGAGKSTIINVLTRFYDIQAGTITIDDSDIRDVTQNSLRAQVGVVLQHPFLFSDTVMNNICYGSLHATEADCIEAAKLANADGFIRRLPQGYDTMLTERGSNLSQGQRQLLTIARTILANPRILILDEATSSVDTRTEKEIQVALRNLMQNRTSFVIAHRLSTIRDADRILVLDDGRILEQGTHDALMATQGFYYDLYMSQFKQHEKR